MSTKDSIMERKMEELGVGRRPKAEKLPNTLEEGVMEIAYLRGLEIAGRRRMSILHKIYMSTYDHVVDLERQRHKLEKLFVPVTKVQYEPKAPAQYVSPKTKAEILKTWEGMPAEKIKKLIAQLEGLK